MMNKSCVYLFCPLVSITAGGGEKMFLRSPPPTVSNPYREIFGLEFAGNGLTRLDDRFTGFTARFATLRLNFPS